MTINYEGKDVGQEFYSENKEGVYRAAFGLATPDKPIQILKLHNGKLQAGDSWKIEGNVLGSTFGGEYKVGKPEDMTVPAGTYKAYPVTADNLTAAGLQASVTGYYSPGIGLIKYEAKIGNQTNILELEKFEPASAGK